MQGTGRTEGSTADPLHVPPTQDALRLLEPEEEVYKGLGPDDVPSVRRPAEEASGVEPPHPLRVGLAVPERGQGLQSPYTYPTACPTFGGPKTEPGRAIYPQGARHVMTSPYGMAVTVSARGPNGMKVQGTGASGARNRGGSTRSWWHTASAPSTSCTTTAGR